MSDLSYEEITTDRQLLDLCDRLAAARWIAFDTEFVSENTYRGDLCLIQVAYDGGIPVVIDPLTVREIDPFWEVLADSGHETIVHAGREEIRFCLAAIGRRPRRLFDIQLAAGLIGQEYPAAYHKLISRLLNINISKGETRTDWRRRPLSDRQIEYALIDVIHLRPASDAIGAELDRLGRRAWIDEEIERKLEEIQRYDRADHWRRISGVSSLTSRQLAVARELWNWRETVAHRRNKPAKRILRDDLLVLLARNETSDTTRIRSIRGFERRDLQALLPDISSAIQRGLQLADRECPGRIFHDPSSQSPVLGQLMAAALAEICRIQNVAPSLVGTVQDVRDFITFRLEKNPSPDEPLPLLLQGWRADLIGRQLDDLLSGRLALTIENPQSDHPLGFRKISP